MHRGQRRISRIAFLGAHTIRADDRTDDADGTHQQREDDALVSKRGVAENHCGDDGDLVRLENIRRHTRAVADVVADVVRDGRRVPRVVFRNVFLDLADEIRADVRRLRVDAAAHAHEQRDQRAAKSEAEQHFIRLFAVRHENQRAAEQTQTVRQHPGDRARAVPDLQRAAERCPRRRRHAQIAERREPHTDEPDAEAEQ